ncbi:hypothetical protein Syun_030290 [Stephania yunnanensis]|uniref:Uncharacterized protein n=1 Tax=Stephania yunnanensis TaxID=152371 RepID=A0AAP0E7A6_9MAGN
MAVQLYKLPISAPPKPINPISRPIKMLTTNTISVTSQASSTEKVLSKRKLPILLFDIMDTIVRDPFYHDVPEFFSDDSGDGFLVSSLMPFKELMECKHPTAWIEFEKGLIDERELAKIFFKDCRPLDLEGLKNCMKRGYSYMGGVEALLKDLKENNYEMHAFTNYPDWPAVRSSIFSNANAHLCSCSDIAVKQECKRKPDADAYLEVLRRLEVDPGNCIFIDDRMTNVEAAQNVGILGIQFKDAASLRRELSNMGVETCSKNEDALNTS